MDFSSAIIKWYEANKRMLPWRETSDPYKIWVSEVILQQTRVEQGYSYYGRFLEKFPDVGSLARAPEDEVLKVWQGLGYYSRARHMHQAAREICERENAQFPGNYNELIRLKGIGDYSASAISSIAFDEPRPVIDGNVLRVMARYLGINMPVNTTSARKQIKEILEEWIDKRSPGTFNQAVMELGAVTCTPRNPKCMECPVSNGCYAFRMGMTASLPVMEKAALKQVQDYFYFVFVAHDKGRWCTWLKKREGKGIWRGLYDFPLVEAEGEIPPEEITSLPGFLAMTGETIIEGHPVIAGKVRHLLSHRELMLTFIILPVSRHHHPGHLQVDFDNLHNYPVPRPIEKFLKKLVSDRVYF